MSKLTASSTGLLLLVAVAAAGGAVAASLWRRQRRSHDCECSGSCCAAPCVAGHSGSCRCCGDDASEDCCACCRAPAAGTAPTKPGVVVLVNGASSSGKTTLGQLLQERFLARGTPMMRTTVDTFMYMAPAAMYEGGGTEDGFKSGVVAVDGQQRWTLTLGQGALRMMDGFRRAVAALARAGNTVVVDDVFFEEPGSAAREQHLAGWADALAGLPALLVGLRCSVEGLEAREAARAAAGDPRPAGSARAQAGVVHAGVAYDVDVDTTGLAADAVADQVQQGVLRCIGREGEAGAAAARAIDALGTRPH